ncbi:ribbon-helix-helix protein, CopG family [Burkholderia cepacia]
MISALQALAERTGITVSEHIRRAIDAYLKKNR